MKNDEYKRQLERQARNRILHNPTLHKTDTKAYTVGHKVI